ncbi:MAG: PPC domain-containing DNA-binding protein [Candidatus Faecivicinus sp.]
MRYFAGEGSGRKIVVNLSKGEDILEGIGAACREMNVKNAMIVSAIGSARKMRYHYVASTADDPENVFVTIDRACEIGAIQGLILDGDVHAHAAFSDAQGRAYNGHLEVGCEVLYLLEVSLVELGDLELKRYLDEYGVCYIDRSRRELA